MIFGPGGLVALLAFCCCLVARLTAHESYARVDCVAGFVRQVAELSRYVMLYLIGGFVSQRVEIHHTCLATIERTQCMLQRQPFKAWRAACSAHIEREWWGALTLSGARRQGNASLDDSYDASAALLSQLLLRCAGTPLSEGYRPLRLVLPAEAKAPSAPRLEEFVLETGFRINTSWPPYQGPLLSEVVKLHKEAVPGSLDVFVYDAAGTAELAEAGAFTDITQLAAADKALQWNDFGLFFRAFGATYQVRAA